MKEVITTRPAMQEVLKGDLQDEVKGQWTELQSLVKTKQDKCMGNYKASTAVLVYYHTFYFLYDLKDKHIKIQLGIQSIKMHIVT